MLSALAGELGADGIDLPREVVSPHLAPAPRTGHGRRMTRLAATPHADTARLDKAAVALARLLARQAAREARLAQDDPEETEDADSE